MLATGVRTVDGTAPGASGLLAQLRSPYKEGQGTITRRIAYWAGVAFSLWGAFDLWAWLQSWSALKEPFFPDSSWGQVPLLRVSLSGSLLVAAAVAAGAWVFVAWYLKRPWLADLLIDTESEMKKVSWPGTGEAWTATKVVAATVFVFTVVLMVFDFVITRLMNLLTGLPL